MAKKKNYSKKAGGPGLMAALSDYQREHKQKETYKPKNTPKLDSNRAKNNTTQAFSRGNNFGALLKKDKPERSPQGSQNGPKDPPKSPRTPRPETHSAHNRTVPYRSRAQGLSQSNNDGTHGRPMPSNPPGINSKPKPGDYKTRQAFLNALEKWMKKKNRATSTRTSSTRGTTRVTDGRQYGG